MSFQKVGMLKIAKVQILDDLENWGNFKKEASVTAIENKNTSNDSQEKTSEIPKDDEFEVVASINPEKFIYIHTTIMAGVKTEENGYNITAETEKFINDNNDAWTNDDLLKDHKSFKRATTFVEHDQRLENAKGKCIDVIARDMGDTILIDVLFSVDRRHKDLVANIENGIINAVSMGCSTAQTVCSICGNVANDPENYCKHLKNGNKGSRFKIADGTSRRSAEICKGNTFFDVSLVANPAFAGAVFRNILASSQVSNYLLANILNSKIEAMYKDENILVKAASKEEDIANISIKNDGSVKIIASNLSYTADDILSKEDIDNIKTFIPQQKSSGLTKIIETIFGKKEASHPIENKYTEQKDFSISDHDYSEIPFRDRHETLDDAGLGVYLDLVPIVVIEIQTDSDDNIDDNKSIVSRVEEFECLKCGFKSDLWKVKASSVDAGNQHILECPQCFYAAEEAIFKTAKKDESKIKGIKNKSKITVTKGKEKGSNGTIIALRGPFAVVKLENEKTIWKKLDEIEMVASKKSNVFIASKDIPVDNDEGTYWFNEKGSSVIAKGEKVAFIGTVDNGEYGFFVTETKDDLYVPMSLVNDIN